MLGLIATLLITGVPRVVNTQARTDPPRAVTPGELARAKLYDRGFEANARLVSRGSVTLFPNLGVPQPPYPDYRAFLREQTCSADLVVVGSTEGARSLLNASETFLFTDYAVRVVEVVRGQSSPRQLITMSRAGGSAEIEGKRLKATINTEREFDSRRRYLLFLKSLAAGAGYQPMPRLQAVELQGSRVLPWPKGRWTPPELFFQKVSEAQLLADVRQAAAACRLTKVTRV